MWMGHMPAQRSLVRRSSCCGSCTCVPAVKPFCCLAALCVMPTGREHSLSFVLHSVALSSMPFLLDVFSLLCSLPCIISPVSLSFPLIFFLCPLPVFASLSLSLLLSLPVMLVDDPWLLKQNFCGIRHELHFLHSSLQSPSLARFLSKGISILHALFQTSLTHKCLSSCQNSLTVGASVH